MIPNAAKYGKPPQSCTVRAASMESPGTKLGTKRQSAPDWRSCPTVALRRRARSSRHIDTTRWGSKGSPHRSKTTNDCHASAETVTDIAFAHLLLIEINPVFWAIVRSDHKSMTQDNDPHSPDGGGRFVKLDDPETIPGTHRQVLR